MELDLNKAREDSTNIEAQTEQDNEILQRNVLTLPELEMIAGPARELDESLECVCTNLLRNYFLDEL